MLDSLDFGTLVSSIPSLRLHDLASTPTVFSVGLATFSVLLLGRALGNKTKLPPGPRRLPILGNIFLLRTFAKNPWLKFTEWYSEHGPVVYLNLAGQSVVILNTAEAAYDLFVVRGANFSDRPRLIMAGEILAGGIHVGFVPFGPLWRKLRKAVYSGLNTRACETYFDRQESSAINLVKTILSESNPDKWDQDIQRSSALNMFSIIYGMSGENHEAHDQNIARINDFMDQMLKAALPGNYFVDIFPVLNKLPPFLAKFKREGMAAHAHFTALFGSLMSKATSKNSDGLGTTFCEVVGASQANMGLSEEEVVWLSGAMLGGGIDTTAAAIAVFVLAMIHNPHVMEKAQAEIDAVVGRDRAPQFSDRDRLPYISAIIKETLRWRPITPLGLARRATEAEVYRGYVIPAGSLVLTNVWAMNHNPEIYENPDKFVPERYLDADGVVRDPQYTRGGTHAYGFGRRACAGLHLANDALFINVSTLLWAFDIKPSDPSNLPSIHASVDTGVVVRPADFPCKMIPRDGQVRNLANLATA
ncbi:cytochrome P450 [Mycena epipterygia]|nr:cytochrome P450 [Mycena epipterygia]